MKFTPESIAACSVRIDSSSSTAPHDPPIAHAPKLIAETAHPVRPNRRYSIRTPCISQDRVIFPQPCGWAGFFYRFSCHLSNRSKHTMRRISIAVVAVLVLAGSTPRADVAVPAKALHVPTMAQFMSAAFPLELVAAKKADRIAWIANDKGLRNVFTAAAPDFRPVRVTAFLKDDGVDTTQLSIS